MTPADAVRPREIVDAPQFALNDWAAFIRFFVHAVGSMWSAKTRNPAHTSQGRGKAGIEGTTRIVGANDGDPEGTPHTVTLVSRDGVPEGTPHTDNAGEPLGLCRPPV